jgi:fibronectin-binding autotransporter adhesin
VAIAGLTMTRGEQTQGFTDGRGGAISYRNSSPSPDELTVKDCVIENSGGSGVNNGGIYAEAGLSVINTQIINNTSGIYISSNGGLDVRNSWIANNTGDGIFTDLNTVLTNSTLSGNGTGTSGDGVYMGTGNATVTNCTFTGNKGRGFVINYQGTAVLTNCTLVGNVGSDLLSIGGNAIPRNSIVDKLDTQNGFGAITSQGNNLFRSATPSGMTVQASDVRSPGISTSNAFGGSLKSGTYYYVIGAVTAAGTLTSAELPDTLNFNSMEVKLSWTAPVGISGVTGYKIFRGTALGGEKLIATVSAGTTSITDTGVAAGTTSVPLLLGALANNGGPVSTIGPTPGGSVYTRNKGNPAFAPFLDERGYLRNPILPGIGAFESVNATPNTVSLSPASLPGIDQGLGYSQSITASGGTGTGYLIGITAGALPPGLTLTLDGALAGTATTVGSFAFTVTGFDSAGNFGSKNYTLNVNPAPSITTSSLLAGNENAAYSTAILTSGGTAPFTWSYTGTLPSGITFDTSSGTFGGTPTAGSAGTYNNIQVTATDSDGESTTPQTYSMVVDDVSLGALSFNQWTVNKTGFIGTIAATGTGAFTLSSTSGKLPTGMTVALSGGLITFAGKPTVAGTYTFTLKLTDSLGVTATRSYTIVINPATTFAWTGLGADANWTTPGNWSGAGAVPLAGDTLIFGPGATQKTANNNFPSATQFAALCFQDSGYTITGNNLKLSAGISSTSTAGGTDTVAVNVALTATETFNIAGNTLIDVTGAISGTLLGITKTATGTLAYDSPAGNTYTGLTTVSGGTLQLNTSNQIADTASLTVNVGAVFDLNGHDETLANLNLTGGTVNTGSGTLALSGNVTTNAANSSATINGNLNLTGATPQLSVNNGTAVNDLVIAASISASSLTKLGLGTVALSGNNASYTGTTKVSSGILDVQNPAALGSGPVVALIGTTVQLDGTGLTVGNALTLGSTGGATLGNLAGSNTWSGPITDAVTSTVNVSAGTLTVNGGISGASGITKTGTGTLLLPGANSYTGITTVNAGILDVQTPAALGNNTSMTVAAAGTLQIDGTSLSFSKTLSLSGTVASLNGSNTWSGKISTLVPTSTVNVGAGQSLTLSGIISGAGGLTVNKTGSGTLILTNANTYTGATTIKAGIAFVQNKTALGSTVGATTVSSGATLQLQGGLTIAEGISLNGVGAAGTTGALESVTGTNTWTGTISLASASTIAIDAGQLTISGVMSGVGSLTQVGAGSLIVSALNTYTGGTTVNGGTLGGGGKIGALVVSSGATIAPNSTTTKILKTGNVAFSAGSTLTVTLNGTTAGTGYDQLSVMGTVNLAGATLNVNLGFTPALGSAFMLIQNDGIDAVVGTFAGLPQGATLLLSGMTFKISYVGGTGNDVVLTRIA